MDACGVGLLYEKENLSKSFGNKALKFSFEKFRYMCILSGCDYLPSLHGIGLAKACKFFTLTNNTDLNVVLSKLPSYLKMPRLVVPSTYIESFIKANNTFLYQLVFCPKKKCLVPLNPYPEDVKLDDMEYAGKYLPDELARQLAMGDINVRTMKKFEASWQDPPDIQMEKSVVWGSQNSSTIKSAPKVEAFKFNTPKQKVTTSQKRQFTQMAEIEKAAMCTDEELFSMYGSVKKSRNDSDSHEENPIVEDLPELLCKGNSPQNMHPATPFRKLVRSRFFAETTPIKGLNSSSACSSENNNTSPSLSASDSVTSTTNQVSINDSTTEKLEFNVDFKPGVSKESPASTSDSVSISDRCEFSIDFNKLSPKKTNKENIIHRFGKKKPPPVEKPASVLDVSECDTSIKEPKKDTWLDIIDEECNASTSTICSNGLASKLLDVERDEYTKPVFLNNPLKKKPAKKLIVRKIQDFKWAKKPNNLNLSLGSDGTSANESFDCSSETNESATSSQASDISPYFSSFVSKDGCSTETAIDLSSDSNDELDSPLTNASRVSSDSKALKPLNNKSNKPGKCRTLGLSKNSKISRKETLLNFNFIRQPKKTIPVP